MKSAAIRTIRWYVRYPKKIVSGRFQMPAARPVGGSNENQTVRFSIRLKGKIAVERR